MSFTNPVFFYIFLPMFLISYSLISILSTKTEFIKKYRMEDILLVCFGTVFYAWACFDNIFFLMILIILTFVTGRIVKTLIKKQIDAVFMGGCISGIAIISLVLLLYKYKYADSLSNLGIHFIPIITPLGLSFLVFTIISYIIDVYHGSASGDLLDLAVYISFFPKIISGPIITWDKWIDIYKEKGRVFNAFSAGRGIERIIVGIAKKVIIADYFGSVILRMTGSNYDTQTAWLISILYMFEIYLDFSGYSDIAIGLCNYIGVEQGENFCFPYVSTSITEFWRRWQISLGEWFKKYLYIPLGGNRKGEKRAAVNSMIVMFISGIWHGAGFGYILWGMSHGLCMVFERLNGQREWFNKIPAFFKWVGTMFVVMLGWQVFRTNSFASAIKHIGIMFGVGVLNDITFSYKYYLDTKLIVFILIAFIGSTGCKWIYDYISGKDIKNSITYGIAKSVALLLLLIVSIICMTNATYSPFIYFQY